MKWKKYKFESYKKVAGSPFIKLFSKFVFPVYFPLKICHKTNKKTLCRINQKSFFYDNDAVNSIIPETCQLAVESVTHLNIMSSKICRSKFFPTTKKW